jgi:carbon monoxide dehydrogenase subunit G
MVVDFEVTALEDGRCFETKQEGAGVSANLTWSISPIADDSSTFTLSFDGELSGWLAGLASGLLRNQAQKDMKRDLANLKSNIEAG